MRPLPLGAVGLLALNDHLLKGSAFVPTWLAGKLSDVAGLYFFPLLLAAVAEALVASLAPERARRWRDPIAILAVASTTFVFGALKVSPWLCAHIAPWLSVVPDPTDLLALPMTAFAWWSLRRAVAGRPRPAVIRFVGILAAATAAAATSPGSLSYPPRAYWSAPKGFEQSLACGRLTVGVTKSGREGIGVTFVLRPTAEACVVTLDRAALSLGDERHLPKSGLPMQLAASASEAASSYLVIPFDNARAWRESRNHAQLSLELIVSEKRLEVLVPLVQALKSITIRGPELEPHGGSSP